MECAQSGGCVQSFETLEASMAGLGSLGRTACLDRKQVPAATFCAEKLHS
jgi:hypothetical protein